jgi:hypothetical protein
MYTIDDVIEDMTVLFPKGKERDVLNKAKSASDKFSSDKDKFEVFCAGIWSTDCKFLFKF